MLWPTEYFSCITSTFQHVNSAISFSCQYLHLWCYGYWCWEHLYGACFPLIPGLCVFSDSSVDMLLLQVVIFISWRWMLLVATKSELWSSIFSSRMVGSFLEQNITVVSVCHNLRLRCHHSLATASDRHFHFLRGLAPYNTCEYFTHRAESCFQFAVLRSNRGRRFAGSGGWGMAALSSYHCYCCWELLGNWPHTKRVVAGCSWGIVLSDSTRVILYTNIYNI